MTEWTGLKGCLRCGSNDIIAVAGGGILCHSCGRAVGGEDIKAAVEVWNSGSDLSGPERQPRRTLATLALMALAAGVNAPAMLGRIAGNTRAKKVMGPGKGTNRMRRFKQGKRW